MLNALNINVNGPGGRFFRSRSCACNDGAAAFGSMSAGGGPVLQRVHKEEGAEEPRRRVRPDRGGGEQVGRDGATRSGFLLRLPRSMFTFTCCLLLLWPFFCRYAIHNSGKSLSVKKVFNSSPSVMAILFYFMFKLSRRILDDFCQNRRLIEFRRSVTLVGFCAQTYRY